jgi:hypothetical protein
MTIVNVYEPSMVLENTQVIIKNPHSAYTPYPSISVPDINIPYLRYPSVEIVEYRYVLNLNNGTIVIVLYKRVIIETGIKCYAGRSYAYAC